MYCNKVHSVVELGGLHRMQQASDVVPNEVLRKQVLD